MMRTASTPQNLTPLHLRAAHVQRVMQHVCTGLPLEVCGLMGGVGREVREVFPVPNVAKNPRVSYYMDPQEQIRILGLIERRGWELVAIYHSHPPGARTDPSPSDVAQAYWTGVVYVIVVPDTAGEIASLRAFLIDQPSSVVEIPIAIEPEASKGGPLPPLNK
mgnify:CR=1 FL=1